MPGFYKDELSKLEDIEALLVTARDLADRFKSPTMYDTVGSIRTSLQTLRSAKSDLIDERQGLDGGECQSTNLASRETSLGRSSR